MALVHFPVVNRKGMAIGSALTTIDMHDIARASQTFGVKGFYVITPFADQAELANQVIDHWTKGVGGQLNPSRKQALELIRVVGTFEQAVRSIEEETKKPVVTVATSAKPLEGAITIAAFKQALESNASHVLVFGTAWGLSDELIDTCDIKLEPITGTGSYNHLSVRSAASIFLDRITNGS
ncbi:MAG: RNA methyltransferase [Proteobacteria bacterium]|nr:RNA methyltransferase [Pseudomonadota bacterium]